MAPSSRPLAHTAALVLLAAPTLAQTVHEVPFGAELQPFIDAAAAGDIITFEAPFHWISSPLIVTKGLTIVDVELLGSDEAVVVRDLPTEQSVVFRNFRYDGEFHASPSPFQPVGVRIENCAGIVSFETCVLRSRAAEALTLSVENSQAVLIRDSAVLGTDSPLGVLEPTQALRVVGSSVWIQSSEFEGGNGGFQTVTQGTSNPFVQWKQGVTAMSAADSRVFAVDSTFTGGSGRPSFPIQTGVGPMGPIFTCVAQASGAAGATAIDGSLLEFSACVLVGGPPGSTTCTPSVPNLESGPPSESDATSTVSESGASFGLAFTSGTVHPGDVVTFELHGAPGDFGVLAFGPSWSAPSPALAGFGLWLDGALQPLLLLGALDAAGLVEAQVTAATLPSGHPSISARIQGATLNPSTGEWLGLTPGSLTLLP